MRIASGKKEVRMKSPIKTEKPREDHSPYNRGPPPLPRSRDASEDSNLA